MMHSLGRSTLLGWQGSFVGRSRRKHGGLLHCSYFRPFKRRDQGSFECSKIPLFVFFWIGLECTLMRHQFYGRFCRLVEL